MSPADEHPDIALCLYGARECISQGMHHAVRGKRKCREALRVIRKSLKNLGRGSACILSLFCVHEGLYFEEALDSGAPSCCMCSLGGSCSAVLGPSTSLLYSHTNARLNSDATSDPGKNVSCGRCAGKGHHLQMRTSCHHRCHAVWQSVNQASRKLHSDTMA